MSSANFHVPSWILKGLAETLGRGEKTKKQSWYTSCHVPSPPPPPPHTQFNVRKTHNIHKVT